MYFVYFKDLHKSVFSRSCLIYEYLLLLYFFTQCFWRVSATLPRLTWFLCTAQLLPACLGLGVDPQWLWQWAIVGELSSGFFYLLCQTLHWVKLFLSLDLKLTYISACVLRSSLYFSLRLAISKTQPWFVRLAYKLQQQITC